MAERVTILLVENDWLIRITFAEYLSAAGYKIIEVGSAEDALTVLKADAGSTIALVTNVRLRGSMDGLALARYATHHWPWIKLLVVSGETPARLADAPKSCTVLRKPIDPARVVAKLQTMINRPGS